MRTLLLIAFLLASVLLSGQNKVAYKNDLGTRVNVKVYGAIGNGSTNDQAAIQSAIDSRVSLNSKNLHLYFPEGRYLVNTGLLIKNFNKVIIEGDNAVIINGQSVADTLIHITTDTTVTITGLKIDMNNKSTQADVGIVIENVREKVTVQDCQVYNFGTWNAYGLWLYNVGNEANIAGMDEGTAYTVTNCAFYNEALVSLTNYSYSVNNTKGIGIMVKDSAEYGRIILCDFFNISGGIEVYGGANATISNNNMVQINAYQAGALKAAAGVYIRDCAGNNGKILIMENKMNHNWTTCIKSDYDEISTRPSQIQNNQFIANQYYAIVIGKTNASNYHFIQGNFFDRCYNSLATATYPFAEPSAFILLNNSAYNHIEGNTFFQSTAYGIVSRGTSDNNYITNNIYETITTKLDSVAPNSDNVYWNNHDATDMDHYQNDTLYIEKAFRLGNNTDTPGNDFVVSGSGFSGGMINTAASSSSGGFGLNLASDDGATNASGDRLGYISFMGRKTSGTSTGATIEALTGGAWATNLNTYLSFATTNTTSRTEKLNIAGIGTITQTYNLYIQDSLTTQRESSVVVPAGIITIASAQSGFGTIFVDSLGVRLAKIDFSFQDDGVTFIDASYHQTYITVTNTNGGGSFNVYDGGTSAIIQNSRAYSVGMRIVVNYATN